MAVSSHSVSNDARKSVATNDYDRNLTLVPSATCGRLFPKLAKTLFPAKPVQSVAYYCNVPERTACRWVAGEVDPTFRALVTLLRSDQGWRVLCCLMSKEIWWLATVDAVHAAEEDQLQLQLPL